MTDLKVKTKNNIDLRDKPRVYFTCHPQDFDLYFERVTNDIFRTHDCAVYYTADMSDTLPEDTKETDLDRMNMFVIPVSFRLLTTPNRAMDEDLVFAERHKIPILPVMLENGIDEFYARRFGNRQYLSPYNNDATEIPYEQKLKNYLNGALLDEGTIERIRKAFDAYIFLSYRKKDRKYANELMKMIHSDPVCRNIAIWYDEFLTPGEDFSDMIGEALDKSEIFALLVTPNLVNEDNYVRNVEYPEARRAEKPIFPALMQDTDINALKAQYEGIPDVIDARNDEMFRSAFIDSVKHLAGQHDDNDPEHCFLMGLAYLDGIDVEVNSTLGVGLINSAAEAGLAEAMKKLCTMYRNGDKVQLDYDKALCWGEKLYVHYRDTLGEDAPETLSSLNEFAKCCIDAGSYKKAAELAEKCYMLRCKTLGGDHPDTLVSMNVLAAAYYELGDYGKAFDILGNCYELRKKIFGEEHPDTLTSLNNLATAYSELGDYKKALELKEKCYELRKKVLGDEHPDTLSALNGLAIAYNELGDHKKDLELTEKCYELRRKVLGDEHPKTLSTLSGLALSYCNAGDEKKYNELTEKCYKLRRKVLGEEHPDTLASLNDLANSCSRAGDHEKDLELTGKCYDLRKKVLGEEHPDTLESLRSLAISYNKTGNTGKAAVLTEKLYGLQKKVLGEEHDDTLSSLSYLAALCGLTGSYEKEIGLTEKLYELRKKVLGEEHPDTVALLNSLAICYKNTGDPGKSLEKREQYYELRKKALGEEHPDMLSLLKYLAAGYKMIGNDRKAAELSEKYHELTKSGS